MGAAALALLNTAETLFLKQRRRREPAAGYCWRSSGLLVVTTGVRQPRAVGRRPTRAGCRASLLMLAGVDRAPLLAARRPRQRRGLLRHWCWRSRQVLALGMLTFWVALADLVTGRQAKRLYAPLTAGITHGHDRRELRLEPHGRQSGGDRRAAASSAPRSCWWAPPPLRNACGTPSPAAIERGLGRAAARPSLGLRGAAAPRRRRSRRTLGARPDGQREPPLPAAPRLRPFCGGLLGPVLYFEFSYVADAATSGTRRRAGAAGRSTPQFRGWLNIATLVAQLWLSSRLYHRLGIPLAVALWPI